MEKIKLRGGSLRVLCIGKQPWSFLVLWVQIPSSLLSDKKDEKGREILISRKKNQTTDKKGEDD